MSFSETLFLFVLALVIFGPKKLPEIARQIGKVLNEFRRASNEFKSQIEQEIAHLEVENRNVENKKQTIQTAISAPEGTASRTLTASPSEPATLAVSPERSVPDVSNSTAIATEAIASADAVPANAVISASSQPSPSQDIAQDTSQRESQESHA